MKRWIMMPSKIEEKVVLLPCPFCGGNDITWDRHTGVYCRACEVWVGAMGQDYYEAAKKWNTRPSGVKK